MILASVRVSCRCAAAAAPLAALVCHAGADPYELFGTAQGSIEAGDSYDWGACHDFSRLTVNGGELSGMFMVDVYGDGSYFRNSRLSAFDTSELIINDGNIQGNTTRVYRVFATGQSRVVVNGGLIPGLVGYSTSQVIVNGGTFVTDLEVTDEAFGVVYGGDFGTHDVISSSTAGLELRGGLVDNAESQWDGRLAIYGGEIADGATSRQTSVTDIYGGALGGAGSVDKSTTNVRGGTLQEIKALDESTLNVYGGVIDEHASVGDDARLNIYGGSVAGDMYVGKEGTMLMSGGDIGGDLFLQQNARVFLEAMRFAYDDDQDDSTDLVEIDLGPTGSLDLVFFSPIFTDGPVGSGTGKVIEDLTITWRDGTTTSFDLRALYNQSPSSDWYGTLTLRVPTPGVSTIAMVAGLGLLRRRR